MSLPDAVRGFINGLRRPDLGAQIVEKNMRKAGIRVVNAAQVIPTVSDIPMNWSNAMFSPGRPIAVGWDSVVTARDRRDKNLSMEPKTLLDPNKYLATIVGGMESQFVEDEPRRFQYPAGVNSMIAPRICYGLTSFADLKYYAENVPDVISCVRLLTEELKTLKPRILDANKEEDKNPEKQWIVTYPDGFNPFNTWLSLFLQNALFYDAPAVFTPRDSDGRIMYADIVDGSTIFILIDPYARIPKPPAPAFMQVIYGVPRNMFNTYQLWYHPRQRRLDAPYGRSPIEDAMPAVQLLEQLWMYEKSWYTEGTMPEAMLTAPDNWSADDSLNFEDAFNARQEGNTKERAGRLRMLPAGVKELGTKTAEFRQELYSTAANTVRMMFGIPRTEYGESPGTGLGGAGFLEAMQANYFRMGLAPIINYVQSFWNYVLDENYKDGSTFELSFPTESLDPKKEEEKWLNRWEKGAIQLDEFRSKVKMKPDDTGKGNKYFFELQGGGQQQPGMPGMPGMGSGTETGQKIPVRGGIPVKAKVKIPVVDEDDETVPVTSKVKSPVKDWMPAKEEPAEKLHKARGVDPEDDNYVGAPAKISPDGKATIGSEDQPKRKGFFYDGKNGEGEALFNIDRALAIDTNHYLVPVTYTYEADGKKGMIVMDHNAQERTDKIIFDPGYIEHAAALDYIAGANRGATDVMVHAKDATRPILTQSIESFKEQPESIFFPLMADKTFSPEMINSLQSVASDEILWSDIEELVGKEAAAAARNRAHDLVSAGTIPEMQKVLKPAIKKNIKSKVKKKKLNKDFDPNEPRDETGEWKTGGEASTEQAKQSKDGFYDDEKTKISPKNHIPDGKAINGKERIVAGKKINTADVINDALDSARNAEINGQLDLDKAKSHLALLGNRNPSDEIIYQYAVQSYILNHIDEAIHSNAGNQIGKWNFDSAQSIHDSFNSYLERRIHGQHARWTEKTRGY